MPSIFLYPEPCYILRTGYTLPVFAVAAAKAALLHLQNTSLDIFSTVTLNLLPGDANIEIQQVARLTPESALGITLSDPGDNLDLTRHTPIWAWVQLQEGQTEPLILEAGEGLGKTLSGDPAIYRYARRLFDINLLPLIPRDRSLRVKIVLPEGRQLAQRTSNEAFGIVDGLSLIGTSGISQPLSAEDHLEEFRQILQTKVQSQPHLVFCIGSHGIHTAKQLGIPEAAIAPTGNWIGPLLVEASLRGAQSVRLLGYQGKLIKLAGGIFNTSSHLADAKLEIISAALVRVGGPLNLVEAILAVKTADEAYQLLVKEGWSDRVFSALAHTIQEKAQRYVHKYANKSLVIGTILCDRAGNIIAQATILPQTLVNLAFPPHKKPF